MTEPLDIAVDLRAAPAALPEMLTLRDFAARPLSPPPQLVEGVLHRGCKMVLGGTSKSFKSWTLLDLALSVASGQPWWGRRCERLPVAYLNFELHDWALAQRINALCAARPECKDLGDTLHLWNLRGHNADLSLLRPQLERQLSRREFGLIILDPAYKLLGDRDENANSDIAGLMNEFEGLAQSSGAAVVVAHHFAKGDSSVKSAIDRMSGAGAWARDPDSLVVLTPHEEEGAFTVNMTLRNLPQVPEFVVAWDYPLMRLAADLNPEAIRRPQGKSKVCTDKEFVEQVFGGRALATKQIRQRAAEILGMSPRSADRYLARNLAAELIRQGGGLYWSATQEVTTQ